MIKTLSNSINKQNKIKNNQLIFKIYKILFNLISFISLVCGLIPEFISFQRIFYTNDTKLFLIIYISLLSLLLVSIICFSIISILFKVFKKNIITFVISFIYLLILGLLSLNAYLFASFNLTENGYEVPFNIIMYIIDLIIIFPLYGFYEYYLRKYIIKEI